MHCRNGFEWISPDATVVIQFTLNAIFTSLAFRTQDQLCGSAGSEAILRTVDGMALSTPLQERRARAGRGRNEAPTDRCQSSVPSNWPTRAVQFFAPLGTSSVGQDS